MYCVKPIHPDLFWIGGNDRRLALFENVYPIPDGVSYNAYLLDDEKTVVLDTVDKSVSCVFFENIAHVLAGRPLDYLVVNHMEPDHAATIAELLLRYPGVTIVCNAKAAVIINQFFNFSAPPKLLTVKEGDTLSTGRHTLTFVMAPMVHWPEVMVTYDLTDKTLFSADAFGTFGALNGNLFADEVDFETTQLCEARRYYTNIVGKYGTQVQALLKKAANLEIATVCPLHGPVWRKNFGWFIEKYQHWSTYTPEDEGVDGGVVIAYASVYGNTENTAQIIASRLAERGVRRIKMYDVSVTHPSYVIAEAFRASHLILASTTYNAGIFVNMENLVYDLAAHNLQNRTIAIVENGTWAATAGSLIRETLSKCKNLTFLDATLSLKSSLKESQLAALDALVDAVMDSLPKPAPIVHDERKIEQNAFFKIPYGLYVLSTCDGGRDNGCIINTVMQVTDTPKRISVAVNKANLTHDMVASSGQLCVSVLSTETPFAIFQRFGFQSGRDADKYDGLEEIRTENGLRLVPDYTCAYLTANVAQAIDCGTHTLFIADVTEARVVSSAEPVTYDYYQKQIKPKPAPAAAKKTGYVCRVCGYVYEGETLPPDFICPLCKHGAEDFEKIN